MGRIRTTYIKRMTRKAIRDYPNHFNTNFVENKKQLAEVSTIYSKVIRNKIAGSITRSVKQNKES